MKRLSGLDATFLHLETPEQPMHVGALHLFELPQGHRGRFAAALRRHIAERLPLAPPLRRRLWMMPLNLTNPVWVDALPDLRHHIVEHRLPARRGRARTAGSDEERAALQALVARLHAQRLDRERPLWRFHVIEGLAPAAHGARRVALYTQLHHAAVDGQAAVALANVLLDIAPQPRKPTLRASARARRFELSLVEMISGAVTSEAAQVAHLIRGLPAAVGTLATAARRAATRGGRGAGRLGLAPRTRLNGSASGARAFAVLTLPLPELKALGRAHDATLNDLVLWLVGTALRRHFAARGELPRQSLVAAVPVSLRAQGDTRADNQASMALVSLGTQLADPRRRLAHVRAATRAMKSTLADLKHVLPTDFPSLGVPWLTEAALALYRRALKTERLPVVANLVISNVPGPEQPLYLAGARMCTNYPCSIVTHGLGLNITVQSYDQSLDFGLMADAAAMPEVGELAAAIAVALDELRGLPALAAASVRPAQKPRVPARPRVRKAAGASRG
ncbi:MAG TPA: wax ester/triacylglycerol synthase family O-acyltransferase [Burkholderiaceae bacterium]|nr:wax ester/triacylglycerol synthase family O-acyltransferase [Burkholderiaceae bacterium]